MQFENDWVKVVRVHYAAGVSLPEHTHPPGTTAFVYLNDSTGVLFRHTSGSNQIVNRRITRIIIQPGKSVDVQTTKKRSRPSWWHCRRRASAQP